MIMSRIEVDRLAVARARLLQDQGREVLADLQALDDPVRLSRKRSAAPRYHRARRPRKAALAPVS